MIIVSIVIVPSAAIVGIMAVVVVVVMACAVVAIRRQAAIVPAHLLGEACQLPTVGHVQNRHHADAIRVAAALARRRVGAIDPNP